MLPRLFVAAGAAVALVACGGAAPHEAARHPGAAVASAKVNGAAPKPLPAPVLSLKRSEVDQIVAAGLGAFLQRISLDDHPVFLAGKFHGFRIVALQGGPAAWGGVDIKPGDVVTSVNGFPIERPEQALQAFQSLKVASELRIDYERNGEPRSLRVAIVDD